MVKVIRDTPAGKIHKWHRHRTHGENNPFTSKHFDSLRAEEELAVAHCHQFKLDQFIGVKCYRCDCGILYGKTSEGWRTVYLPSPRRNK